MSYVPSLAEARERTERFVAQHREAIERVMAKTSVSDEHLINRFCSTALHHAVVQYGLSHGIPLAQVEPHINATCDADMDAHVKATTAQARGFLDRIAGTSEKTGRGGR